MKPQKQETLARDRRRAEKHANAGTTLDPRFLAALALAELRRRRPC